MTRALLVGLAMAILGCESPSDGLPGPAGPQGEPGQNGAPGQPGEDGEAALPATPTRYSVLGETVSVTEPGQWHASAECDAGDEAVTGSCVVDYQPVAGGPPAPSLMAFGAGGDSWSCLWVAAGIDGDYVVSQYQVRAGVVCE